MFFKSSALVALATASISLASPIVIPSPSASVPAPIPSRALAARDSSTCATPSTITATTTVTQTVTETGGTDDAAATSFSPTASASASTPLSVTSAAASLTASAGTNTSGIPTANPTTPVAVSRAGDTLVPSAVAEAQERDASATRAFTSVSIKAPNGMCVFIDPLAGDFRENLIPVQLAACSGSPNEKFDFITAGKHNDQPGNTLVVSSLTNGCIGFDSRRPAADQVIVFSCGGRADGGGLTDTAQLVPFTGASTSFVWAPVGAHNQTCLVPGDEGRLIGNACDNSTDQVYTIEQ